MARFRIPYHAQKRRLLPQAAFFSYFSPSLSAPSCCHCPRALPVRRDGDIAPYRHYTRKIRTPSSSRPPYLPRPRGPVAARTPRVLRRFPLVLPARRDGDIAPYRHYTRPLARVPRRTPTPRRIARGGSPPRCAAWQIAHAESFAGGVSVRPHIAAQGAASAPSPPHNQRRRNRINPASAASLRKNRFTQTRFCRCKR